MAKTKKILLILLAAVIAGIAACGIYVSGYYRADADRIAAFPAGDTVRIETAEDGLRFYIPQEITAGLVFYPGGLVEYTAYEPLMLACADRGILCALVEMPFHLAVLDMDAAEGIPERFPQVARWYIGGHSLGGSMAASYLEGSSAQYEGLILLASYSTADLSGTGLSVLSVYGTEDTVLNRERYRDCLSNLPQTFTEYVIEGGCHANFGAYGPQRGDGTPSVDAVWQITETAQLIADFAA